MIDDDAEDRVMFREALSMIDPMCNLKEVTNCPDALLMLDDPLSHVDYVFIDLNLPGMSGKDCITAMRKFNHLKDTPIFVYTTSENAEDKRVSERVGATGYITKPDSFDEIVNVIKEQLLKPV